MLVLTVRDGDYVKIGNDVMVRVMKTASTFRLAFDAPKDVAILRGTLDAEQEEKEAREALKAKTAT